MIDNSQEKFDVTLEEAYHEYLSLTGLELDYNTFLEDAYRSLKRYKLIRFTEQMITTESDNDGIVHFDCPVSKIEYVAAHKEYKYNLHSGDLGSNLTVKENADPENDPNSIYQPYYNTPNDKEYVVTQGNDLGEVNRSGIEQYVPTGRYLDFVWNSDDRTSIKVKYRNIKVDVLARIPLLDSEGFPLITETIAMYIAYYVGFLVEQRKVFRGVGKLDFAEYLKREANKLKNVAITPDTISQNEFNDILDVMTRWDRKRYGHSYRPMLNTKR
jgi:hypothetical protein